MTSEKPGRLTPDLYSLVNRISHETANDKLRINEELIPYCKSISSRMGLFFAPDGMPLQGRAANNGDNSIALDLWKKAPSKGVLRRRLFAALGAPVTVELHKRGLSEPMKQAIEAAITPNGPISLRLVIDDPDDGAAVLAGLRPDLQNLTIGVTEDCRKAASLAYQHSRLHGRLLDLSRFTKLRALKLERGVCRSHVAQDSYDSYLSCGFGVAAFEFIKLPTSLEIIDWSSAGSYYFENALASAEFSHHIQGLHHLTKDQIALEYIAWRQHIRDQCLPNLQLVSGDPTLFNAPNLEAAFTHEQKLIRIAYDLRHTPRLWPHLSGKEAAEYNAKLAERHRLEVEGSGRLTPEFDVKFWERTTLAQRDENTWGASAAWWQANNARWSPR